MTARIDSRSGHAEVLRLLDNAPELCADFVQITVDAELASHLSILVAN